VAIFAGKLLADQPSTIFGDGKQTRDFVFVEDVADAFARAADRGDGLIVNIGTGVETTVDELYDLMAGVLGVDATPRYQAPRPGDLRRSALDPARARMQLGWQPWTSLEEGVTRTIEWFQARAS